MTSPIRPALARAGLLAAFLMSAAGCGAPGHEAGAHHPAGPDPHAALVRNLEKLLPPNGKTREAGHPAAQGTSSAAASLTFKSAAGEAQVQIAASRLPTPVPPSVSSCPDSALHPYSTCTTENRRGAGLILDKSPVDESEPFAGQRWTAALTFRDGRQIVVSESTPAGDAGAGTTRRALPLTLRELAGIAGSTTWQPFLSLLPEPPKQPAPQVDQSVPAKRITDIIAASLPRTVHVSDESGQPGYGHLTVDDGHGKCLVAVTVQRWKPGDASIAAVFAKARRLPDGTRLTTSRGPAENGGRGAVEWRADTLSRDGLRVVVDELNARAYRLPGTRATPVLSLDQLTDLVRDVAWREAAEGRS
ncbi:hypothetical protein GCM10010129_73170 [Streptomyces fumigatiscleroticus]|nr:hypothetical protein GCM10010129_73170 [Streptomyces fumigatiscleroticus]